MNSDQQLQLGAESHRLQLLSRSNVRRYKATTKVTKTSPTFEQLIPGEGFSFNYQPSRIDRNALFALNQVLDKHKVSEVRTKYHRAHLNIDDLRDNLLRFSVPKGPRRHSDAYYAILESVDKSLFPEGGKIIPWTHGSVADYPEFPKQKSPGLPLKLMGYNTKADALKDPEVLRDIRKTWYAIAEGKRVILPDVACYARAQICARDKNKVRATWGYPMTVLMTEGQYFYPLLHMIKSQGSPLLAYGKEMSKGGMEYLSEMIRTHKGANYLVGDYSGFDQHVPAWLNRDAFKILERHVDFTHVTTVKEGKIWDVNPKESKNRWKAMIKYFNDTPIQLSSGERFMKHGGIPSGTGFTNLIGSIANAIIMRYLIYELTGELPLADIYLGDDSVTVTREPLNLELFAKQAEYHFSMEWNLDKSYQTSNPENVHFLGYHNLSGIPYKPIDTVVASSIYPERPTIDKFETITRLVGQAYSCFEPEDAKKFFMAARLLQEEEVNITDEYVERYIKEHPHAFKYLSTIGIKVSEGIVFPKFNYWDLVMVTQARPCLVKYKDILWDLQKLYEQGIANLHYWQSSDKDN